MLKVVGGRHRGRSIATPEGDTTRPTSSRARESLFNILAHANWRADGTSPLIDARVLDAFAGSGALGIEALSRGAMHATFLDPPYRSEQAVPALTALAHTGWLKSGAIATVELASTEDMLPPPGFTTIDERRYGLAKILILRRTP